MNEKLEKRINEAWEAEKTKLLAATEEITPEETEAAEFYFRKAAREFYKFGLGDKRVGSTGLLERVIKEVAYTFDNGNEEVKGFLSITMSINEKGRLVPTIVFMYDEDCGESEKTMSGITDAVFDVFDLVIRPRLQPE